MTKSVKDVMTRPAVTVSSSATFHEMAELMHRHGISAVPVADTDRTVIGSRGD
jgi:CBS domain-containing protein